MICLYYQGYQLYTGDYFYNSSTDNIYSSAFSLVPPTIPKSSLPPPPVPTNIIPLSKVIAQQQPYNNTVLVEQEAQSKSGVLYVPAPQQETCSSCDCVGLQNTINNQCATYIADLNTCELNMTSLNANCEMGKGINHNMRLQP